MIEYDTLLGLSYLKKSRFTGSFRGMRYCVYKEEDHLAACCWPGPFAMHKTDPDLFVSESFPFSDGGRKQAVDWLNEQYRAKEAFFEEVYSHPERFGGHLLAGEEA